MELNFEEIFENTSDLNPLKMSFIQDTGYFKDFVLLLCDISKRMTEEDTKDLLFNKLQLNRNTFNENQYYQSATELCVIYHVFRLNEENFSYEKVVRDDVDQKRGKQPECTTKTEEGFVFNVEAKSPERSKNQTLKTGINTIFVANIGRADTKDAAESQFNMLKNDLESCNDNLKVLSRKSDDNKLKDYLYSAGEKFPPIANENEVNVLFVSLDTICEIQGYVNFLFFNKGLFTKSPFADIEKYTNVDMVIFTNSYYRQKNHDNINGCAWWLNDGFNFLTFNPHADFKRKEKALSYFASNISNFNKQIECYRVPATPETPQDLLDSFRISSFVKQKLEEQDNIFLFQKK
ncbi:MAG: hypothetical protein K6E22_13860 [Treponema sp.]|nr:hypothetical protein [Treponema sp.]